MKSVKHGTDISGVELLDVTPQAIRLMVDGERHELPFNDFPWFRDATAAQLSQIERPAPGHLRWPALDVDLTLESIRQPRDFPLVSR